MHTRSIQLSGPEALTQIGLTKPVARAGFRSRPRAHETAMSLLLGRWDMDLAVREAFGREPEKRDAVRYTTAERVSEAGFQVIHDQQPFQAHVSVRFEGEWTEDVSSLFHECFEDLGRQDG